MVKTSTPEFVVGANLFDRVVATYSGRELYYERIRQPIRWEESWWIVTSMMLSHSASWAAMYEVIPIEEWGGPVFVYGCFDEEWMEDRERNGAFWHGVRVQIEGDAAARQFVLGTRVRLRREANPPPRDNGQPR